MNKEGCHFHAIMYPYSAFLKNGLFSEHVYTKKTSNGIQECTPENHYLYGI